MVEKSKVEKVVETKREVTNEDYEMVQSGKDDLGNPIWKKQLKK